MSLSTNIMSRLPVLESKLVVLSSYKKKELDGTEDQRQW